MNSHFLFGSLDAWSILLAIFFGVVLFIVFREVICWYFKINRIVDLLENIEENTRPKDVVRKPYDKSDGSA